MPKFIIALALLQAASFVQSSRHLQQGSYCDAWNPCGSNQQCWNSHCYPITCSDNTQCESGFQCSAGKCYPLTQPQNNGQYCDQWTACSQQEQCVLNKCVPLNCQRDVNCPVGFVCYNKKCLYPNQSGTSSGYCDEWTPCQSKDQCVDKKCVPFTCQITPNCAPDYVCNSGFCIQINPNHTRGRFCDEKHECDILHVCKDSQCYWK